MGPWVGFLTKIEIRKVYGSPMWICQVEVALSTFKCCPYQSHMVNLAADPMNLLHKRNFVIGTLVAHHPKILESKAGPSSIVSPLVSDFLQALIESSHFSSKDCCFGKVRYCASGLGLQVYNLN